MSRAPLAIALTGVALVAGCGGGAQAPGGPLQQTAHNLGKIHSGRLDMDVRIQSASAGPKGTVGFLLAGDFALAKDRGLPELDVTYTSLAGTRRISSVLRSTGGTATVRAGGKTTTLTRAQAATLASAGRQSDGGLDALGLHIERWVAHPRVTNGPTVDGVATDRITGRLDVVAALQDARAASGQGGAGLNAADRRQLREAVRTASITVLTGHRDRLLRRVNATATLDVPPRLRRVLGDRTAVRLSFGVALDNVNGT